MDEFSAHLKTVQNLFLFFLSFCLVAWALLVDYRVYIAGLMVGSFVSMINARYLAWKILKFTDVAIKQKRQKVNLGFLTRGAIAALSALIVVRYPEYFALSTTIAGYFSSQLATLVLGIYSIRRTKK